MNDNIEQKMNFLINEYEKLKKEYIELNDEILYQNFGLFTPQFIFASLEEYKEKLNSIRVKQKNMIKSSKAAICLIDWKVNGSELAGRKMIEENIKQSIRTFNIECDICIDKVKFNNYQSMRDRIIKSYETINKLNNSNKVVICEEYLYLKLDELELSYSYQKKKKEIQEEERTLRELRREELKVQKELELKRQELEKEQIHYINALKKIDEQLNVEINEERKYFLIEKKKDLTSNLVDVDNAMKDLDYREANHKAGYVYVISNIGAFGPNIYKIGMTRRLDPEDRICELSGASVPFKFDIHAMIFTDDAPKLEAAIHRELAEKKVNLVNGRKEFFNVTLEEIKSIIEANYDKTVDFKDVPEAEQYRETEMIRLKNKKSH